MNKQLWIYLKSSMTSERNYMREVLKRKHSPYPESDIFRKGFIEGMTFILDKMIYYESDFENITRFVDNSHIVNGYLRNGLEDDGELEFPKRPED